MRDATFLLVWTVMFPISFWSAHIGVLLWVWVALIGPNDQLYSYASGIQYNKIVAVVTLGVLFLNRERKQFYLDPVLLTMLALLLVATGSAATALPGNPLNADAFQKLLKEIALAATICSVMWTRHRMHMLLAAVCLGYGFVAMSEGGQFLLTAGGHKILGASSIGDNNQVATAVLMIIPLLLYLIQYSAWRPAKLAWLGMLVLSLLCVVGTFSRGGFVGLVVLGLMLVGNSRNKLRVGLVVGLGAVLVVAFAPESWYARLNTLHEAGSDDSFLGRVLAWKVSILMAMDHPFFGAGLSAVQTYPVWSIYIRNISQLDWIPGPPASPIPRAAHSSYFEVLGDMGFLGLFVFALMLVAGLFTCWRTIRLTKRRPELGWATDMARMVQTTLVVYVITTATLSMSYFEGMYVVLAVSSRLLRTVQQAIAGTLPEDTVPALPRRRVPGPRRPAPAAAARTGPA